MPSTNRNTWSTLPCSELPSYINTEPWYIFYISTSILKYWCKPIMIRKNINIFNHAQYLLLAMIQIRNLNEVGNCRKIWFNFSTDNDNLMHFQFTRNNRENKYWIIIKGVSVYLQVCPFIYRNVHLFTGVYIYLQGCPFMERKERLNCDHCDKTFAQRDALNRHIRNHSLYKWNKNIDFNPILYVCSGFCPLLKNSKGNQYPKILD